jgi:tRNA(fMet)-specific endonuclease VapC
VSFLLDTDTCSAYLKGSNTLANRFIQYGGRLHLSAASLGELYTWAFRVRASPSRMQRLLDMLPLVSLLVVDAQVARKFGELDAYLLDRGLAASEIDLQNAATAQVHDLTLVTHNVRDFANIPDLHVLDWLAP